MTYKSQAAQALIDGARIVHSVLGPSDGAPVVVLHGAQESASAVADLAPNLVGAGFHTHLCNLSVGDDEIVSQVRLIQRMMGEWRLPVAHFVVCGQSAQAALQFAATSPANVLSLTLIDPPTTDASAKKRATLWSLECGRRLAERVGAALTARAEIAAAPIDQPSAAFNLEFSVAQKRLGSAPIQVIVADVAKIPAHISTSVASHILETASGSALGGAPAMTASLIAAQINQ